MLRPTVLFVAIDGPRLFNSYDMTLINQTKDVIEATIDWQVTLYKRYSEFNQGCRLGVVNAITWFFENVDFGIILEDDCIPHIDFFALAAECLKLYRDTPHIWTICASNFTGRPASYASSYHFSKYTHSWGWATWRDRWSCYDMDLSRWQSHDEQLNILSIASTNMLERQYWRQVWNNLIYHNKPDTWDYQWFYTCVINKGLNIIPRVNLVLNTGCGELATHTTQPSSLPSPSPLGVISHPTSISCDIPSDCLVFSNHYFGRGFLSRITLYLRYFIFVSSRYVFCCFHA
jgi:hypothetical protein